MQAAPSLVKRIFSKYDKNLNGTLCQSEFADLCYDLGYHLSYEETMVCWRKLDTDGSGAISFDEFEKWWKTEDRFKKLQLTPEESQTLNSAITYFKYFDKDGSGRLDRTEFKSCYADLARHKLTNKTFEECWEDLDTDKDGLISFNEYVDWLIRIGSLKVQVLQ